MLRFTTFRYAILPATRRNKCAIVFVHDEHRNANSGTPTALSSAGLFCAAARRQKCPDVPGNARLSPIILVIFCARFLHVVRMTECEFRRNDGTFGHIFFVTDLPDCSRLFPAYLNFVELSQSFSSRDTGTVRAWR
jgi:hypothetical protein